MGLFSNGHAERLAALEAEISSLRKQVAAAVATASEASERAYRYMKKAEARARRELDESGTPEGPSTKPGGTLSQATPSSSQRVPWGARGRRILAAMRGARPDPLTEVNGDS